MTFKSCKRMDELFSLDEKFEPFFTSGSGQAIYLTKPLEKGYVYASLFFYDEAIKEVAKLEKMINKIRDELAQETHIEDPTKLFMELSARVRSAIGDDALDGLLKEILAQDFKVIAFLPSDEEIEKLLNVKEAIFKELFETFTNMTFKNTIDVGDAKSFTFSEKFVSTMTERQKKLMTPALRMTGFINRIRLDELTVSPDWVVKYKPIPLHEGFEAKENELKQSIKTLLEENL